MAKIETPAKRVSPSVRDIHYVANDLIPRDCITRNKWKYTQFYNVKLYNN